MEEVIHGRRFKVWKMPNILLVHWVINPGLAINELVFGQRIPKKTYIEQDTKVKSFLERQYLYCENCQKLTNARVYKDAGLQFRLYHGIPCMRCEKEIPAIKNILSFVVILILRPILAIRGNEPRRRTYARQAAKLRDAEQQLVNDGVITTSDGF